jgi:hypothetical protein
MILDLFEVRNRSRASPAALDGRASTSAMPRLRPKSCGAAMSRRAHEPASDHAAARRAGPSPASGPACQSRRLEREVLGFRPASLDRAGLIELGLSCHRRHRTRADRPAPDGASAARAEHIQSMGHKNTDAENDESTCCRRKHVHSSPEVKQTAGGMHSQSDSGANRGVSSRFTSLGHTIPGVGWLRPVRWRKSDERDDLKASQA